MEKICSFCTLWSGSGVYPGLERVAIITRAFCFLRHNEIIDDAYWEDLQTGQRYSNVRIQFTASNKPENVDLKALNSVICWASQYHTTRIGHTGTDLSIRTFMLSDVKKETGVLFFTISLSEEASGFTQKTTKRFTDLLYR